MGPVTHLAALTMQVTTMHACQVIDHGILEAPVVRAWQGRRIPDLARRRLQCEAGVAIDANVLINERIREELRAGSTPQAAISAGFDRAWATILDSNVTTLIVGVALMAFGSGPVRGFAIVHCLGILTSMFSAVFVSRGVVNLWYGRKKKLTTLSIGTVWVSGISK